MYPVVLFLHSWLRYLVLGLGIALIFVALHAWRARQWKASHERVHVAFIGLLDLQLLLGLALFLFLSPIPAAAIADFAAAMKNAPLRFFALEHPVTMLIAVIVAHVARAKSPRAPRKGRPGLVLWTQLLWLALTLVSIPWPVLDIGRPLWRGF